MSLNFSMPCEIAKDIAKRVQEKRLAFNFSQKTLSEHSGVSYGTLKRFERTGLISLESLLKIAVVLNSIEQFDHLFTKETERSPSSIDALLKENSRKRGRK